MQMIYNWRFKNNNNNNNNDHLYICWYFAKIMFIVYDELYLLEIPFWISCIKSFWRTLKENWCNYERYLMMAKKKKIWNLRRIFVVKPRFFSRRYCLEAQEKHLKCLFPVRLAPISWSAILRKHYIKIANMTWNGIIICYRFKQWRYRLSIKFLREGKWHGKNVIYNLQQRMQN